MLLLLLACTRDVAPEDCTHEGALSTCLGPTQAEAYYIDQSLLYFDTLETGFEGEPPLYAEWVARWEWPPWLKLTGYGRDDMETVDAIIRLVQTSVTERECRFFPTQPFGRCRVNFVYEDIPTCPIYEEFTFDDAGEMTFIEAWTDDLAYLPSADPADLWGEAADARRLSTRLPGLGNAAGEIDLDSAWMTNAADDDPDVADFVTRARDFYGTWLEEYESAGPEVFAEGCGM